MLLVYMIREGYRKIPKISPGAYFFQRPLMGLFLEGPIFGGAYIRREVCVSKSARLILGGKFASQNRLGKLIQGVSKVRSDCKLYFAQSI